MNHFLIAFCLMSYLITSSSLAQNPIDVSIKWGPPVSIFSEGEEIKILNFKGAFYNIQDSSFPVFKKKIRLPKNVIKAQVNVNVLETNPLLPSEKNLIKMEVPDSTLSWRISYEKKIPYLIFTYVPILNGSKVNRFEYSLSL